MQCDVDTKLVFPPFIAVTTLRPDIVLYSPLLKIVIILELTCPCEENMEEWHRVKFEKYEPLSEAARSNGWSSHLFPIEVGARGYCSTSIRSCLMRLGFSRKHIKQIMKSLSLTSIKSSFHIWQSRECKDWVKPLSVSFDASPPPANNKGKPVVAKMTKCSTTSSSVELETINCGLKNKGNTCYINASLQCLSTLSCFWSNISLMNTNLSPFTASSVRLMSLLKSSKTALDPSQFLRHLKIVLIKAGKADFNLFNQQDAAEILLYILQYFSESSIHAKQLTYCTIKNEITCNVCFQSSIIEDSTPILQLPVSRSIQCALEKSLNTEELTDENSFFCHTCQTQRPASVEHSFTQVGKYLIIQLKRFVVHEDSVIKDVQKVHCTSKLSVPFVDNEVTLNKKYDLLATVNHTGTLDRGHYTCFIRPSKSTKWYFCNDSAVLPASEGSLNTTSSYIFFFEACC